MFRYRFFVLFVLLLTAGSLHAQQQTPVSLQWDKTPLSKVLAEIAEKFDVNLTFDANELRAIQVTGSFPADKPGMALQALAKKYHLSLRTLPGGTFVITQIRFTFSGRLADAATGEPIPAGVVTISLSKQTVRTDSLGRFRLQGLTAARFRCSAKAEGYVDTVFWAQLPQAQPAIILLRKIPPEFSVVDTAGSISAEQTMSFPEFYEHQTIDADRIAASAFSGLSVRSRTQPSQLATGFGTSASPWGLNPQEKPMMFNQVPVLFTPAALTVLDFPAPSYYEIGPDGWPNWKSDSLEKRMFVEAGNGGLQIALAAQPSENIKLEFAAGYASTNIPSMNGRQKWMRSSSNSTINRPVFKESGIFFRLTTPISAHGEVNITFFEATDRFSAQTVTGAGLFAPVNRPMGSGQFNRTFMSGYKYQKNQLSASVNARTSIHKAGQFAADITEPTIRNEKTFRLSSSALEPQVSIVSGAKKVTVYGLLERFYSRYTRPKEESTVWQIAAEGVQRRTPATDLFASASLISVTNHRIRLAATFQAKHKSEKWPVMFEAGAGVEQRYLHQVSQFTPGLHPFFTMRSGWVAAGQSLAPQAVAHLRAAITGNPDDYLEHWRFSTWMVRRENISAPPELLLLASGLRTSGVLLSRERINLMQNLTADISGGYQHTSQGSAITPWMIRGLNGSVRLKWTSGMFSVQQLISYVPAVSYNDGKAHNAAGVLANVQCSASSPGNVWQAVLMVHNLTGNARAGGFLPGQNDSNQAVPAGLALPRSAGLLLRWNPR